MGGLGLHIELTAAPADGDDLLREAWDVIADRMSRLADTTAGEEILAYYLHFQASDGFADGNWSVFGNALYYSFSDAAGNCTVEMYACYHWAALTVLDRWDALAELAARHGTALVGAEQEPEQRLRAILGGRSSRVFFHHDEHLGFAMTEEQPADDHELWFYALEGTTRTLAETGDDRGRLTELITTGRCACDVCQNLRYFRQHD